MLYLTHLLETEQPSTLQVDQRVALLDLARPLDGLPPFREDRGFQLFLHGLLRKARLHQAGPQSDPLYREHVTALIEQTMRPTARQIRLRAAVLLLHHTGWPSLAIARLSWSDIDLRRRDRTTINWPHELTTHAAFHPSRDIAPDAVVLTHPGPAAGLTGHLLREALDRAREIPEASPYVTWPPKDYKPRVPPFLVTKARRALEATDHNPDRALELVSSSPEQARDRVALVLGYGAALTTREALALRTTDITVTPEGLRIQVPGRRHPIGVSREPGTSHDPIDAWDTWMREAQSWGIQTSDSPALLAAHHLSVRAQRISETALNQLVQRSAGALGYVGTYAWTSLRWGAIRTAIRDNERTHHIARLAGTRLDAVNTHQQREQLITHSVAGQLGL